MVLFIIGEKNKENPSTQTRDISDLVRLRRFWLAQCNFHTYKYRICFIGMYYALRNVLNIAWPIRMRAITDNLSDTI